MSATLRGALSLPLLLALYFRGTAAQLPAQESAILPDSLLIEVALDRYALVGMTPLRGAQKFIIPSVLLYLSIDGAPRFSSVTVRSSASVTTEYHLLGLKKTLAEELAQHVQTDLARLFRAAGMTVQLYDDVRSGSSIASIARLPVDTMYGVPTIRMTSPRTTWAVIAPSDAQSFAGAQLRKHLAFRNLARETGAIVIIPEIWIQAPRVERMPLGQAGTVSVGASMEAAMDVAQAALTFITPTGATGSITHMVPIPDVATGIGSFAQIGSDSLQYGNALSAADLSFLSGTGIIGVSQARAPGGSRANVTSYNVMISEDNYSLGVLRGAISFLKAAVDAIQRERAR